MSYDDRSGNFHIVGRPDVNLSKYIVEVYGRQIINYEQLKIDEPEPYKQLLSNEQEGNRLNNIELDKIISDVEEF